MDRALVPAVVAFPAIPAEADSCCCQHPGPVFRVNRGHCILPPGLHSAPQPVGIPLTGFAGRRECWRTPTGCLSHQAGWGWKKNKGPAAALLLLLLLSPLFIHPTQNKADLLEKLRTSEAPSNCAVCIAGRCPMIDIFIHTAVTSCWEIDQACFKHPLKLENMSHSVHTLSTLSVPFAVFSVKSGGR